MPLVEKGVHVDDLKKSFYIDKDWNLRWRVTKGSKAPANSLAGSDHSNGYRKVKFNQKMFFTHRVIWALYYGEWPTEHIDHINGVKIDNRIENLRVVTKTENSKNRKRDKRNKTGVAGVLYYSDKVKWLVRIGGNKNMTHLGYFTDFFEAVCARKSAELRYGYHTNHGRS